MGLNFFSQFVALGKKESKADFVLIFEEQMISKFLQAKDRQLSFRSKKNNLLLELSEIFLELKEDKLWAKFSFKDFKTLAQEKDSLLFQRAQSVLKNLRSPESQSRALAKIELSFKLRLSSNKQELLVDQVKLHKIKSPSLPTFFAQMILQPILSLIFSEVLNGKSIYDLSELEKSVPIEISGLFIREKRVYIEGKFKENTMAMEKLLARF